MNENKCKDIIGACVYSDVSMKNECSGVTLRFSTDNDVEGRTKPRCD